MAPSSRPPYRADHVGSLLRPPALKEAREKLIKGKLDPAALHALEDKAVRDAVAFQEGLGLYSITDGEQRRASWQGDFLEQLSGADGKPVVQMVSNASLGTQGGPRFTPPGVKVTGKIRHTKPIMLDAFKFLKSATRRTAKVTIPSPTGPLRSGRDSVDRTAYPDIEGLYDDVAAAYRAEINSLTDAGCTYIQLDDTNFAYLCDADMREAMRKRGDDPEKRPQIYARVINAALKDRPPGLTVSMHLCRGNGSGRWAAQGGYEPVAEALFNQVNVDGYFLEYDTDRAGGFEPLRFFPKQTHKRVVLGLISTKTPDLEPKDLVKKRIDEAAKYVPLERLCLSPQCGFASGWQGNPVSADDHRRKLELVIEVANEVWGSAQ
jgi:5-methyltetrahydropteroyltriglutamate--homocysteine methyltransferase